MFEKTIPVQTKSCLALLAKNKIFQQAYLAGGTALALQLGHRISHDLDFFTAKEFDFQEILNILKKIPGFKLERTAWGTVLGWLPGMRFSIFYYNYPLLYKTKIYQGIRIADPRDIAAMKIAAVSDRNSRKDFIDIYFLIQNKITLEKMLELYDKKYDKLAVNTFHIIKSLGYFEEAEKMQMPQMIMSISWSKIKDFFQEEQKRLAKKYLGLK